MIVQRTPHDCAICCIAMLSGRTYEEIITIAGEDFDAEKGMRTPDFTLMRLGYSNAYDGDFVSRYRGILSAEFFRGFAWGHKALLSVPSLNFPGSWHMVYYDGRAVMDPSVLKTYQDFAELLPEEMIVVRSR